MNTPFSTPAAATSQPAAALLCDLDGVVWLAHEPIPGSVDALRAIRAAGWRVLFVTNNSAARLHEHEAALERIGVAATGDVVSSAQAAAALVQPGERALVCGGPGIVEALGARDVECIEVRQLHGAAVPQVDAVVVGFHRDFDYEVMRRASTAVRSGARLIGTNDDATYPTPDGPIPGGGAILAAIRTASGVEPTVAGKPYEPMAALVTAEIGRGLVPRSVMVGDRPDTDGWFARELGCRFALVRSGVTGPGVTCDPAPDIDAPDLAAVVAALTPIGPTEPTSEAGG